MTGWTPLYQQLVGSSVWGAPDHVRLAWITLLAVANKQGIAAITESGLSRLAVISRENAADALKVLSSPDPDTLTQEHEGRRIERVETGWKLLNFQKYRELAKSQALREANAEAQARFRASQSAKTDIDRSTGNNGKPLRIWDLKQIIEAKEAAAKELKNTGTFEDAMGVKWNDEPKRAAYLALKTEIKTLQAQIRDKA